MPAPPMHTHQRELENPSSPHALYCCKVTGCKAMFHDAQTAREHEQGHEKHHEQSTAKGKTGGGGQKGEEAPITHNQGSTQDTGAAPGKQPQARAGKTRLGGSQRKRLQGYCFKQLEGPNGCNNTNCSFYHVTMDPQGNKKQPCINFLMHQCPKTQAECKRYHPPDRREKGKKAEDDTGKPNRVTKEEKQTTPAKGPTEMQSLCTCPWGGCNRNFTSTARMVAHAGKCGHGRGPQPGVQRKGQNQVTGQVKTTPTSMVPFTGTAHDGGTGQWHQDEENPGTIERLADSINAEALVRGHQGKNDSMCKELRMGTNAQHNHANASSPGTDTRHPKPNKEMSKLESQYWDNPRLKPNGEAYAFRIPPPLGASAPKAPKEGEPIIRVRAGGKGFAPEPDTIYSRQMVGGHAVVDEAQQRRPGTKGPEDTDRTEMPHESDISLRYTCTGCGYACAYAVAKSSQNEGRVFRKCPKPGQAACHFHQWADTTSASHEPLFPGKLCRHTCKCKRCMTMRTSAEVKIGMKETQRETCYNTQCDECYMATLEPDEEPKTRSEIWRLKQQQKAQTTAASNNSGKAVSSTIKQGNGPAAQAGKRHTNFPEFHPATEAGADGGAALQHPTNVGKIQAAQGVERVHKTDEVKVESEETGAATSATEAEPDSDFTLEASARRNPNRGINTGRGLKRAATDTSTGARKRTRKKCKSPRALKPKYLRQLQEIREVIGKRAREETDREHVPEYMSPPSREEEPVLGCWTENSHSTPRARPNSYHWLYNVFHGVISRCFDARNPSFWRYGARKLGDGRCWFDPNYTWDQDLFTRPGGRRKRRKTKLGGWLNFVYDVEKHLGRKPSAEYSLDRIDPQAGYWIRKQTQPDGTVGPMQLRWADKRTQRLNQRPRRRLDPVPKGDWVPLTNLSKQRERRKSTRRARKRQTSIILAKMGMPERPTKVAKAK